MDVLAHGLWGALLAKAANAKLAARKSERRLDVLMTAAFGFLPDLVAFSPIFVFVTLSMLFGGMHLQDLRPSNGMNSPGNPLTHPPMIYWITGTLYQYTHSLVMFAFVAALVLLFRKAFGRPRLIPWEMSGWLLHILIDIPTHSSEFYPTPFIWPLSNYRFDGYAWSHPAFQLVNYTLIALVFLYFRRRTQQRA